MYLSGNELDQRALKSLLRVRFDGEWAMGTGIAWRAADSTIEWVFPPTQLRGRLPSTGSALALMGPYCSICGMTRDGNVLGRSERSLDRFTAAG
jgi:hypothetical protein